MRSRRWWPSAAKSKSNRINTTMAMIAVDTNVLVRLFVNDDMVQSQKARALFDMYVDSVEALWIADIVMLELAWTLERIYEFARAEICTALKALAGNATVSLESMQQVNEAITLYEQGPAGFADCLLAAKARHAGCDALRTFDKKMKALPGVKLL